ncbi:MAG: carboxypeptidase regulatory-like domain-containing protein [Acidobacteriota bacterium]|nr:carboxypeptidase regulatory-like domain-containing protein [Acidobacteriota bacterium]
MFSHGRPNQPLALLASWLIVIFTFHLSATAQVAGGSLSGTVADTTGAIIRSAKISLKNEATGATRDLSVNGAGFYIAPNLLVGDYDVAVSASGFKTETQTGIHLTVGSQQVLNFTMSVGLVTERVQVTGTQQEVQLASSSLSAVVDSTTMRELPLNGRSWTDLATLQPGVNSITSQFGFGAKVERGNRGFGDQIAINGARPQMNNYRLDGISINDRTNGGPGSVLGGNLGVDAVQEFSVITSNQSAEYGRTAGGVVNAISRAGTNGFHGSVYEFLRNSVFDARNFFDVGRIPAFKRNQFGGTVGGPIRKDKIFIFGDYEGIRQSKGITALNTVPSNEARNGRLCSHLDTLPPCTPTTIAVDPSALKYLPFWPAPNGGIVAGTNGDIGIFNFVGQEVIHEDFFTGRADVKISDNDSIYGSYLHDVAPYTAPDSLNNKLFQNSTKRQVIAIEETHIVNAALTNSARFGYSQSEVINVDAPTAINPLAKDPNLAAQPGNYAAQVVVGGITAFGGGINKTPSPSFWHSYQMYDDAFLVRGSHSFKFGAGVEVMHDDTDRSFSNNGEFFFGTLASLLQNKPTRFLGSIYPVDSTASTVQTAQRRQSLFALYLQDDWHARQNLTLNLGLRWEMVTNPTQVKGTFANLIRIDQPTLRLGAAFASNPSLLNFEPRVGFAWDPFHNGKTAVRGSFGVFDVQSLAYLFDNSTSTYPTSQNANVNGLAPGTFFTGAFQSLKLRTSSSATYNNARRAYVMQRSLNIQRELTPSLIATVGYVGSRGNHMPLKIDDANTVTPVVVAGRYVFPTAAQGAVPINPAVGKLGALLYNGDLSYNALQVGVQKRMGHGVQLQGSFTWGKAIDSGSGSVAGDQFSNGISSLPAYNLKSEQGLADYSIGRTLVINALWQTPSTKWDGAAGWISNGWQLGTIFKASDGVPFTPTWGTGGDPSGLQNADDWAYTDHLSGPGCKTAVNPGNSLNYIKTECFSVPIAPSKAFYDAYCDKTQGDPTKLQCFNLRGTARRNSLIGPGIMDLDASMYKNNYVKSISETFNVQFRAEFFNVLNHTNFALPVTPDNTDIFDSSGAPTGVAGLLKSTTTTAREIQFAVKVIW